MRPPLQHAPLHPEELAAMLREMRAELQSAQDDEIAALFWEFMQ